MNTHLKAVMLIVMAILILSPVSAVAVSESPSQSFERLTLVFLYDRNHDGLEDGVGAGKTVDIYRQDELFATGVTNSVSTVSFLLPLGTYDVYANLGFADFPIYYWKCTDAVDFFTPGQLTVIDNCREVGIQKLLLPFLGL